MLLLLPGPGHWATRDTDPGKVRPRSLNNNDDHLPHMSTVVQYPHYPHTASINLTSNQHPASRHSMASMGRIPKHGACTQHGATISSIAPSHHLHLMNRMGQWTVCPPAAGSLTPVPEPGGYKVSISPLLPSSHQREDKQRGGCGKHSKWTQRAGAGTSAVVVTPSRDPLFPVCNHNLRLSQLIMLNLVTSGCKPWCCVLRGLAWPRLILLKIKLGGVKSQRLGCRLNKMPLTPHLAKMLVQST